MKKDKNIYGFFLSIFFDTAKIVEKLGKEPPVMTNPVSDEKDLTREIYERLLLGIEEN